MNLQFNRNGRVLCLHAAAKRLNMPERTLRYQASRGRIQGAFKQGKLWKFPLTALEDARRIREQNLRMFAALALAIACLLIPARAAAASPAPDFTLQDSQGRWVSLSKYKGKVVLLNFWATWCHGCKLEIPWFMEFEKKYQRRGLAVVGVALDEDGWRAVKPYLQEKKMNYRVVLGNADVARRYGVNSMPMTLLIDREGRIASSHAGVVGRDACESEIRMLLPRR